MTINALDITMRVGVTGILTPLLINAVLAASSGIYSLTGTPSSLEESPPVNEVLSATSGSYSLTGTPTGELSQYTLLTPSADSRIIYVSDSLGNDANDTDGFEISGTVNDNYPTPLKTIAKAKTYLRTGFPDWLVLKRGDTWFETLGQWKISGRSPQERMVVYAYGSGTTRPLLKIGTDRWMNTNLGGGSPASLDNLVFKGFEVLPHTRVPFSPEFTTEDSNGGLQWLVGSDSLLIEDCKFSFCTTAILFQGASSLVTNLVIRKNVIVDDYNVGGNSQGIFINDTTTCLIEENILDHNGWHETFPGAGATLFNHNLYIQQDNVLGAVDVINNIIMRASSHGVQLRCGGLLDGNLVIENSISLLHGGGTDPLGFNGKPGRVHDNIILNGKDITPSLERGFSIQVVEGLDVTVENNIIAHVFGGDPRPINLSTSDATETNNITHDWGPGNDSGSPSDYVDHNVSIELYNASVGGLGTRDDFFAQLRAQSEDTYNVDYDISNIKQYFLDGFTLV